MNIFLATAELHPFSKTGGLADMVSALGKSLAAEGHTVGVVTPLYRGITDRFPELRTLDYEVVAPMNGSVERCGVRALEFRKNLTVYFVDHPGYYDRAALYGEENREYPDNPARFVFFSKAVVHLARYLGVNPELVHVHDWQAGLVPVLMKNQSLLEGWKAPRSTITIHNLAYQGHYTRERMFPLTNLADEFFNPRGVEFNGGVNCLKSGIVYADAITTVSPRYAREICTEEYGCSLDPVLRERQHKLKGILNGVDYEEWNTTKNIHLHHHYTARSLKKKALNKRELQHELGLPVDENIPLFGTVTRLVDQKGVDILLGALEEMLACNMQFALLGSGDPEIERAYRALERRHPKKVCSRIGYDLALSHRIEAGIDFFLMPSRFEPCGLNQMYSLRYGTIPIVRRTGGLDDSVADLTDNPKRADGIKFTELTPMALARAIKKALVLFETPDLFDRMRVNAMTADFSWKRTTAEYVSVYQSALG